MIGKFADYLDHLTHVYWDEYINDQCPFWGHLQLIQYYICNWSEKVNGRF